jgi:Uma2 family endonuclease
VRSKNDSTNEVRAKKDEYFDAGVQLVWVLDPGDRTVAAHQPGQPVQMFGENDTLTTPLLPGFAVPLAELFAE